MAKNGKGRPERKFRIGFITATVWLNEGNGRQFRSVDVQRSYRDGDEWKSNSTFTLSDMPQAIEVMRMALNYVAECESDVTDS